MDEANDESRETYNISNLFKLISMIKSTLCDYSDTYLHVAGMEYIFRYFN